MTDLRKKLEAYLSPNYDLGDEGCVSARWALDLLWPVIEALQKVKEQTSGKGYSAHQAFIAEQALAALEKELGE